MSLENEIKQEWQSISQLTIDLGTARDAYLAIPGEEGRFMEMEDARRNLFDIETAAYAYLETKAPIFGSKPDDVVLAMIKAVTGNAKILLELAKSEAALKTVSSDGKLSFEQNMILLQNQMNDPRLSEETKSKAARLLKMGLEAKRKKFLEKWGQQPSNAPNN